MLVPSTRERIKKIFFLSLLQMPSELPELTQILFNTALQVAIEKHYNDTNGVTAI